MPDHSVDEEEPHPLLTAGWRQGVLFHAPGVAYGLNERSPEGGLALSRHRQARENERLILISHACDIKAQDEKYVEALICRRHDPVDPILGRWDQNSPLYFLVDPDAAFVADARHRVKIAKDGLIALTHTGIGMDDRRLRRFIEWLTRRYDRPNIPDALYERLHRPLYMAFRRLADEQNQVFNEFNSAVNDIRIRMPQELNPPYSSGVIYLTGAALTSAQLAAIDTVHQVMIATAKPEVVISGESIVFDLDQVPYGVILRTQPLIIEYPSWENEDAASPSWLREQEVDS